MSGTPAEIALSASDREWNNDAVAFAQIADRRTCFDDFAHELVSENIAVFHGGDVSPINMEVRATNRGQ